MVLHPSIVGQIFVQAAWDYSISSVYSDDTVPVFVVHIDVLVLSLVNEFYLRLGIHRYG